MRDAAAGRLELTTERRDGATIVRAEGEVDLESAEALAAVLKAPEEDAIVVVDLIGVPFMDSSGLRTLLVASKRFDDRLALVISPGSPVAHLLELAAVRDRFAVYGSAEEAIDARTGG